MRCASCQAECPEQAEACFTCGKSLFALTQGALLGGRYEIVRPVGKGGMSRVYEAYDRVLGEPVAIKVLRAELAWEPEMRQRFLHEIRLARRVTHPNVCRIHEYGEDGPRRYLSMELVEGVNLKDVLRNRGLSTEEAFDLVLQMADGLGAVHQHGIVHRDFKASNIMVARNGVAKLMDFGIAKHAESDTSNLTTPGQVLGTPEYMSPEHARGARVDLRSDIYALGCVVFEVFTGQAPFRGPNAFATISKHFYEAPPLDGPLASLIPEALVPVLRTCLAKDPERRYKNVAAAREALVQAQAAAVPQPDDEAAHANGVGSPRLRRLCEDLLGQGADGGFMADDDSSRIETTPPIVVKTAPPAGATAAAARAAAAPRGRGALISVAAVAAVAIASAMLLWPASRDVGVAPGAVPPARRVAAQPTPEPSPSAAVVVPTPAPSPAMSTAPSRQPRRLEPTPQPRRVRETAADESPAPAASPAPALWTTGRPTPPPTAPVRAPERTRGAAATGTLRLLIVPWAEAVVDGTSMGTVQLREVPLAPGPHTVLLLHPDFQPWQRKVTIEAGTVVPLVVDLSEKGIRRTP